MKKLLSIGIVLTLILSIGIYNIFFAGEKNSENIMSEKDIESYSKELRITNKMVSKMTYEEAEGLIAANATLEAYLEPSYSIFLKLKNENNTEVMKIDLEEEMMNLSTEEILENYDQYDVIDFGKLKTSLEVYDVSDEENIIRHIAYTFEWVEPPLSSLVDFVNIQHTGNFLGYTHMYDVSAYYRYYLNGKWNNRTLKSKLTALGRNLEFDLKNSGVGDNYGRVWIRIGNIRSAIKKGDFDVFGSYEHSLIFGKTVKSSEIHVNLDGKGM